MSHFRQPVLVLAIIIFLAACTQSQVTETPAENAKPTVTKMPITQPLPSPQTPRAASPTGVEEPTWAAKATAVSPSSPTRISTTLPIKPTMTNTATPTNDFAVGNTLILYTVQQEFNWALKSWPDENLLSDPIFDIFYGQVQRAEDIVMYFLNFHPQISPNNSYLLLPGIGGYVGPGSDLGTGMWLIDLTEGSSRQLLPRAQIATWNPDSDKIAYVNGDTLYTLSVLEKSTPVPLFTHPDLTQLYARWSPDGQWVAVATTSSKETDEIDTPTREDTYWLIPTNDGTPPRQITSKPGLAMEGVATELEWSYDSQFLLVPFYNKVYNLFGDQISASHSGSTHWAPNNIELIINSSNGMQLVTLEGDELVTIGNALAWAWAFSKDGKKLAYTQPDTDNQVKIFTFDLGEKRSTLLGTIPTNIGYISTLKWSGDGNSIIADDGRHNSPIWIMPAKPNSSAAAFLDAGVLVDVLPKTE